MNRRLFLRTAAALAVGAASRTTMLSADQPVGANGDIRVAVIGLRSKGRTLLGQLREIAGVRVVGLCDVDPNILTARAREVEEWQGGVFSTTDLRRIYDRPDIDAVVIATGNHWHALATVWACQAGKDVYVEKPVSHTIWEGCKMLEAEEKYGRIIQVGTQFRSDTGLPEAVEYIRNGELGRVQYIHALYYKERANIGRREPWYPTDLDYDLFCGPAPVVPLERNQLHYDWHWNWTTGNGDLGNLGVHCVDIARRFLESSEQPDQVISLGGRHVHADAAETPNTQLTVLRYRDVPLFFESRGLPAKPGVRYMDSQRGLRQGVIVQCEHGYFSGFSGGIAYDNKGAKIRTFPGDGGSGHMANFIDSVRGRRRHHLAAPLRQGHHSTSACLAGNISYRLGRAAPMATARDALASVPPAQAALDDIGRHLAAHGVDVDRQPLTVGPWLHIDGGGAVTRVEAGTEEELERARFLTHETHRPQYRIPDAV